MMMKSIKYASAIFFAMLTVPPVFAVYGLDKTETTVGDNPWVEEDILKMTASLDGTDVTFAVVKTDGGDFASSGTICLKVGTYQDYGQDRECRSVPEGTTPEPFTHDLDDYLNIAWEDNQTGYPKEFYFRYTTSAGQVAWVGPIWVSYEPDNVPPISNQLPIYEAGSATPTDIGPGESIWFESVWSDPEDDYIVGARVRYCNQGTGDCEIAFLDWIDDGNSLPHFGKAISINGIGIYDYEFFAVDANPLDTPLHADEELQWYREGTFSVEDGTTPPPADDPQPPVDDPQPPGDDPQPGDDGNGTEGGTDNNTDSERVAKIVDNLSLNAGVYQTQYSVDKDYTQNGKNSWDDKPALEMRAFISGNYITFEVSKADGNPFTSSGNMQMKVGNDEASATHEGVLNAVTQDSTLSVNFTFDLAATGVTYPRSFYARYDKTPTNTTDPAVWTWVGPITVFEENAPDAPKNPKNLYPDYPNEEVKMSSSGVTFRWDLNNPETDVQKVHFTLEKTSLAIFLQNVANLFAPGVFDVNNVVCDTDIEDAQGNEIVVDIFRPSTSDCGEGFELDSDQWYLWKVSLDVDNGGSTTTHTSGGQFKTSSSAIKNSPLLLNPRYKAVGVDYSSGVEFEWDYNNPESDIKTVFFTLRESTGPGDNQVGMTEIGDCRDKDIGKTLSYNSSDCGGTLQANQWYKWATILEFQDGSKTGDVGFFRTPIEVYLEMDRLGGATDPVTGTIYSAVSLPMPPNLVSLGGTNYTFQSVYFAEDSQYVRNNVDLNIVPDQNNIQDLVMRQRGYSDAELLGFMAANMNGNPNGRVHMYVALLSDFFGGGVYGIMFDNGGIAPYRRAVAIFETPHIVSGNVDDAEYLATAAHELGHAFNVEHGDDDRCPNNSSNSCGTFMAAGNGWDRSEGFRWSSKAVAHFACHPLERWIPGGEVDFFDGHQSQVGPQNGRVNQ